MQLLQLMPKHGKSNECRTCVGNGLRHEYALEFKEVGQYQQERNK